MIPFSCPCCEVPHPPHREGCTLHADGEELAQDFDEVSSLRAEVARLREERRGWLTEEERETLEDAADAAEAWGNWQEAKVLRALLARETPPRVRRPNVRLGSFPKDRDDAWIAAIREAGGEVEG